MAMKILTRSLFLLVLSLPVTALADTASALANAPSITAQELYAAQNKGLSLYGSKEYQQAGPHLMLAAQHGLKNAQATLGLMHLTGNGVDRSAQLGIGWLGVAADGKAGSRIKKTYKDAIESIPREYRPEFDKIVHAFVSQYGTKAHGVRCEGYKPVGTNVKQYRCHFADSRYGDQIEDPFTTISHMNTGGSDVGSIYSSSGSSSGSASQQSGFTGGGGRR
ncbi:MAG TPA: sel1 repeat family protein [Gammaproteobacteria bacterium]|nr:sel1 repeat family protein [Gammaproteobacteria bacterium]